MWFGEPAQKQLESWSAGVLAGWLGGVPPPFPGVGGGTPALH
jgi:hypothetical protein